MPLKIFWTTIALVATAVVAFGWLAWKCDRDPKINFLPRDQRAEWIVFPAAIDARSHPVVMIDATFRQTFSLDSQPGSARLLVRAAKRVELRINGEILQIVSTPNWKQISTLDVSKFFHTGPNAIEARVFNDDAPPALWLTLVTDSSALRTDQKWEASLAGSSWRNCALASVPRFPGPGNSLAGGEKIFDALPKIWRTWFVFAIFAILLIIALQRWNRREGDFSRGKLFGLLGLCVFAWLILFWNNAKLLPFHSGYDANDHVAYIKYIQERGTLPLPNEGYEMFQPPLYYALSAGVLSICRLSVADDASVIVLRALTMLFGIANFVFVFLSLRLLFPARRVLQVVGLVMAAFLPMQLYLSHYVTNETLAATLASATIYLGLRTLKSEPTSMWQYAALGICTGAAMLAKVTSLLLIPPLLGAIVFKLVQQRAPILAWLRALGLTVAAILVTCGWHYVRIYHHFGTPIVGNWDPALGFPWWQDPGFHTAGDYFRFGHSVVAPMFSGFSGFADGIYSTLWGDALGGGLSDMLSRTPWNYHLVAGGYLLALVPTLLVVVGALAALYQFVQRPAPEWFFLLGISAAVIAGLVFMTLRVPSYAQVKAFYGLSILVSFCCFAGVGWQKLERWPRLFQLTVAAVIVCCALNSFAGVWIRNSATQHLYAGRRFLTERNLNAALAEANQAVRDEPSDATAQCFLAALLDEMGKPSEAIERATQARQVEPVNNRCQLQLAINLAKQGKLDSAMAIARRVAEAEPENSGAHKLLFICARQLRRGDEPITTGRDVLALTPFDAEMHYRVGLEAGEIGDFVTAIPQFAYALLLQRNAAEIEQKLHLAILFAAKTPNASANLTAIASSAPDSPLLLNELAWLLATNPNDALRDGPRAVQLSERACALTERKQPVFLATTAAAHAEIGKFSEAIATAREAGLLAQSTGDAKTAGRVEKMLITFQANQPYREEPAP